MTEIDRCKRHVTQILFFGADFAEFRIPTEIFDISYFCCSKCSDCYLIGAHWFLMCFQHVLHIFVRWRRMTRNCIFRYQSLDMSYLWVKNKDCRHFQLAIWTVFHAESESAVRIDKFLHPEEKLKKNQPMRVWISYRKISYCLSPPYSPVSLSIGTLLGAHVNASNLPTAPRYLF